MKKVVAVLFSVICCIDVFASNVDEDKKPIHIRDLETENISNGRERNLFLPISAYINYSKQIIEIEYNDLEDGYIYVCDEKNQIVDMVDVSEYSNSVAIFFPDKNGLYRLIIRCNNYSGEGVFEI